MHVFLHNCLILVRSTGIEPKTESLKAFIYKDSGTSCPNIHQFDLISLCGKYTMNKAIYGLLNYFLVKIFSVKLYSNTFPNYAFINL